MHLFICLLGISAILQDVVAKDLPDRTPQKLEIRCAEDSSIGSHRLIVTASNVGESSFAIDRCGFVGFTYKFFDASGKELEKRRREIPIRLKDVESKLRNPQARFLTLKPGESLQFVFDPFEGVSTFVVGVSESPNGLQVSAYEEWLQLSAGEHFAEVRVVYEFAPKPEGFREYFGCELSDLKIASVKASAELKMAR